MRYDNIKEYVDALTYEQRKCLDNYLARRFDNQGKRKKFNVVFDLLHQCNLACRGCGTNAKMVACQSIADNDLKYSNVIKILDKIKLFANDNGLDVYVNFGGGEPFLRNDIIDILKYASVLFGADSVGVDTNASLETSFDKISAAMNHIGYLGVSINGLKKYHNWWSNNDKIDSFSKAISTVQKLCETPEYAKKIEVTTVATKKNMASIPELMAFLSLIGVKQYSVHRLIPVGRMEPIFDSIVLSSLDYFNLLVMIAEQSERLGIQAHIHHSIEGIYGALVAGIDTFCKDNIIANANYRSSIGIEPNGDVVVDPWCTVGFWSHLKLGNVLKENVQFKDVFNLKSDFLDRLRSSATKEKRCNGCEKDCSGGSRVVAAATELHNDNDRAIDINRILKAMETVDPACPIADMEC